MINEQAVIAYIGDGSSVGSSEAIIDCISRGDKPERALLLSSPPIKEAKDPNVRRHGFFLEFETLGWFVVSSGYASGYGGTGPTQLSKILSLLDRIFENISEFEMDENMSDRLSSHKLLVSDIDAILEPKPLAGSGIFLSNYIYPEHFDKGRNLSLLKDFAARLPLSMLHPDLTEIALDVFTDPIGTVREACTVMEHSLKQKSKLKDSGTKLFDNALKPRVGKLKIINCDDSGEQAGLQFLAKGFYQLHRNPLMHRSAKSVSWSTKNSISELLVVNHILFQFSRLVDNPEYSADKK